MFLFFVFLLSASLCLWDDWPTEPGGRQWRCFQFGVGIYLKPLLEQEAFHKYQGRIGFITIGTLADGIVFHEQIIDSGPIHDGVDLLHSLDGSVLFDGSKKRKICKGEIGFHFLEAMIPPEIVYLKEVWHNTT